MAITIPPANKVANQGGFIADIDNAYAALQQVAGVNVLNSAYAGGADPTGVADSTAAFAAAISAAGAGTVYVPPGTYLLSSGPLSLATSGLRITGAGWGGATLTTTAGGLFTFPSGGVSNVEVDHLTLDVTGGHAFSGQHVSRSHFHHLLITQRSSGFSVWDASALTLYLENLWEEISYTLTTASRTVPAWNFVANGSDLLNANTWRSIVANNNGPDSSQYQWWLQCNAAGDTFQCNKLQDITFENPLGGEVAVLSGQQTILENLRCWDLSTNVSSPLIKVITDATSGVGPAGTVIRDCGRTFGPLTGSGNSVDILLDSGCTQTLIENYSEYSGTPKTYVNLGGSDATTILGAPANLVLSGTSGASWTLPGADGIMLPADHGLIAWAYDPATISNSSSLTAGTAYFVRVPVRCATSVSKLWVDVATAATSITAGQNWVGLYTIGSTTATLQQAAAADTIFGSTGPQSVSITSTAVAAGYALVGFFFNATGTALALGRNAAAPAVGNLNLAAAGYRFFSNSTGNTTALPGTITLASNTLANAGTQDYWAAVS